MSTKTYAVKSKKFGEVVRLLLADEIRDDGKLIWLYLDGKFKGFWKKDRYEIQEVE